MSLQRRDVLKTAAGMIAGTAATWAQPPASPKPNLIFILPDDLGINGLSCYGADKYRTPNLDRLAAGGIRYTRAYTAPLCGPSRALIMTGRYAFRTGATNQDATGRITPSAESFLPKLLKPAGYVSAMIGKWGQLPLGPSDFGFDEYLRFTGSGSYWNSQDKAKSYSVNGQKKVLGDKQYLPDAMHDFLVDFMTRHRNQPFFAYYSMSHVHAEILPTPDSAPDSRDHYADNIHYMDKLIGKLVAELDRLNLRKNTLLVFFGDNGTGSGYADAGTIGGRRLSGEKGSMLEGGANVPMIVNWPGKTPAGVVSADLVDSTDFLPSFLELAGLQPPARPVTDGHSLAPQWQGRKGKPREWVFVQLARKWYVRDSRFKLDQDGALFDMREAPFAEPRVPSDSAGAAATAARKRLQAALESLNPAAGILDDGDGTGRHAKRQANRKKNR
jgi:arylsulfatase A